VWRKEGKTKEPVVAEGEDVRSVLSGDQSLLVENGGLWKLTEDGLAIEWEIHFVGFKEAWVSFAKIELIFESALTREKRRL
jgi:4a-hydroxytetrahydrobiopterin dehydratase